MYAMDISRGMVYITYMCPGMVYSTCASWFVCVFVYVCFLYGVSTCVLYSGKNSRKNNICTQKHFALRSINFTICMLIVPVCALILAIL